MAVFFCQVCNGFRFLRVPYITPRIFLSLIQRRCGGMGHANREAL